MNILVTGGLGYIGSHTVVSLYEAGHTPIIIDNCSNCQEEVIDKIRSITLPDLIYYRGDIRDDVFLEKIFSNHKIDAVIHFAAKKAVGESMEIPFEYYDNNVQGTLTLTRIMKKYSIRHIIFSSTCAVYSPSSPAPYDETMATGPESVYAMSKLMIEEALLGLNKAYGLHVGVLRYFNPIGTHPSGVIGETPQGVPQNLMPYIMDVIANKRDYLSVYGDNYDTRDGTCIRDYIHVMDLATAHIKALEWLLATSDRLQTANNGVYEIINLGTGTGTTVFEMIAATERCSGRSFPYKVVDRRTGDLPVVYGNIDKASRLLGRTTKRSIEQGINDMLVFSNLK